MATIVEYDEKFTSAKTVYADIDVADKMRLLERLTEGYYTALEAANYDNETRKTMLEPYPDFRKHQASGDPRLNNCLQSFLAGLLKQHHNRPNKDISTKMLKGIQTGSLVLKELGYMQDEIVFQKRSNPRQGTTPFEKLFQ